MNYAINPPACPPPPRVPDDVDKLTSKALKGAIQSELKEMIEGDITIANLHQISRFAHTAQELLMVRHPIADIRRKRTGMSQATFNSVYSSNPQAYIPPQQSDYYDYPEGQVLESAPNETFATKLIRELVPALTDVANKKVVDYQGIVDAIAEAKEKGLDIIAAKLEKLIDDDIADAEEKEPEACSESAQQSALQEASP